MFTYEEIAAAFEYDPETGIVLRKKWIKKGRPISETGRKPQKFGRTSYFLLGFNGTCLRAHRIAWMLTYKEWPPEQIDHIDGDGLNNKLSNLRCVSNTQNQRNASRKRTSKSGVNGVYWCKLREKWVSQICIDGKQCYLGAFTRLKHAAAARKEAEKNHGYHQNHGR